MGCSLCEGSEGCVVSVVIPTYNASRYLDVQLRALRAQTVKAGSVIPQ